MKRLLVDMDGVLADVYQQFYRYHQLEFGVLLTPEMVEGKTETEAFVNGKKYVNTPGFFLNAPLMNGAVEVLDALNKQYDLYIVSAAMEFPLSLHEKHQWLQAHFPFLNWTQFVFCGSKKPIQGDIMIDDHYKNLDHFSGETILFTQPHNRFLHSGQHRRVQSWFEIGEWLLGNEGL